jgi:hypothetical protein
MTRSDSRDEILPLPGGHLACGLPMDRWGRSSLLSISHPVTVIALGRVEPSAMLKQAVESPTRPAMVTPQSVLTARVLSTTQPSLPGRIPRLSLQPQRSVVTRDTRRARVMPSANDRTSPSLPILVDRNKQHHLLSTQAESCRPSLPHQRRPKPAATSRQR